MLHCTIRVAMSADMRTLNTAENLSIAIEGDMAIIESPALAEPIRSRVLDTVVESDCRWIYLEDMVHEHGAQPSAKYSITGAASTIIVERTERRRRLRL